MWCVRALVLAGLLSVVFGHGRLYDPPGRSTAWRHGFQTPVNFNDNELFCGGFEHQWNNLGGKCGICGDPWDAKPRENEAGGTYATGTIVRTYKAGDVITATIHLTTNHIGYFEFRLCPNNNIHKAATQQCLDQYVLPRADGRGTKTTVIYKEGVQEFIDVKLRLPAGLTCEQCVFQWLYNTGNRWGTDPVTGEYGLGIGPQEQFLGCADIAIKP